MRLFVGDDWAEDHHDIEVMDEAGKVLARRRLPEGAAGMAQLHELAAPTCPGRTRRWWSGSRPAAARGWRR